MNIKYFIMAIFIHFFLFYGFSEIVDSSSKMNKVGKKAENISVNLTMTTLGNSNKTQPKMITKKTPSKIKKTENKKVKAPKEKIENKKKITQVKKINKDNKGKIANSHKKEKIIETVTPPKNDGVLGERENDKNLVKIKNGKYALKNQKVSGIKVVILNEIPPVYPELALKMGYRKETIVKVKFLVNEDGIVEDIEFYTHSKYGFEKEVEKALKKWKFKPILYKGKPTSIYFYKIFNFIPNK
jgi:protein TonB